MLPPQDRKTGPMPADVLAFAKGRMMNTHHKLPISTPSPFATPFSPPPPPKWRHKAGADISEVAGG